MNKKNLLNISLVLNVVLACLCLYLSFSLLKSNETVEVATDSLPALNDNDALFMGESRMGDCEWSMLLSDATCKTLAFNGNTIKGEIERLDQLFQGVSPRKLFLMYGEQELLDGCGVGEISERYDELVSRLKERFPATECVLISVLPVWKETDNEFNLKMSSEIKNLNIFIKSIASRHNYPFVDLYGDLSTSEGNLDSRYITAFGSQLNYTAYVIIKERLNNFL